GRQVLTILELIGQIPDPVTDVFTQQLTQSMITILVLAVISFTVRFFIYAAQRAMEASKRNARLLRGVADVGQILTSLHDEQQIFERSITLIQDRFGFYHVQVFLIDENGDYAQLVASTGEPGRQLLARRHRL